MIIEMTCKTNNKEDVPFINTLTVKVNGEERTLDRSLTDYHYGDKNGEERTLYMKWYGIYYWNGKEQLVPTITRKDSIEIIGLNPEDDLPQEDVYFNIEEITFSNMADGGAVTMEVE